MAPSSPILTVAQVAVLFARQDSVYKRMPMCDVYDIDRDARTYDGTLPVVAHPPCRAWGRLRQFANPRADERNLARLAVALVREFGGVLEHPAGSLLWQAQRLPVPGCRDPWGGWTISAPQFWWGHKAEKMTWFYIFGCEPTNIPDVPLVLGRASHVIKSSKRDRRPLVTKQEREHTPEPLARWLVELAARCQTENSYASAAASAAARDAARDANRDSGYAAARETQLLIFQDLLDEAAKKEGAVMNRVTIDQVLAWSPCYRRKKIESLFAGRESLTAADILSLPISVNDRLWAVLREELIPAAILHEFACRCAEQAMEAAGDSDPRSVAAIESKRAWVRGDIRDQDLSEARSAASHAALDAAREVDWNEARQSAREAAWEAAYEEARSAALEAARDAARDASAAARETQLLILQTLLAADAAKGE